MYTVVSSFVFLWDFSVGMCVFLSLYVFLELFLCQFLSSYGLFIFILSDFVIIIIFNIVFRFLGCILMREKEWVWIWVYGKWGESGES